MQTYSTQEVADLVGIHLITLYEWLSAGKVRASQATPMKGRTLWRWTKADVKKVSQYKAAHYRKGRGRKKKPKRKRGEEQR
jgi:excisionase family DNA binding protein